MSDTQQRIDDLVKHNDVVLFMKGSASFPMCGFSGRAIQILKACGVEPKTLKTVNVLEDEGIRQGIMMSEPPMNSPFTYSCGMVGQLLYSLMP